MVTRSILNVLVFGLVLLLVAFAVLMAFQSLVAALGDVEGARALSWAAITCSILLVTDLVLLVAALGIRAMEQRPGD